MICKLIAAVFAPHAAPRVRRGIEPTVEGCEARISLSGDVVPVVQDPPLIPGTGQMTLEPDGTAPESDWPSADDGDDWGHGATVGELLDKFDAAIDAAFGPDWGEGADDGDDWGHDTQPTTQPPATSDQTAPFA